METVHRGDSEAMIHGMAWGGTLAVALAVGMVAAIAGERGPWDDWVAARELHRPTYAERIHPEQLLRTRANTWSNRRGSRGAPHFLQVVDVVPSGALVADRPRRLPRCFSTSGRNDRRDPQRSLSDLSARETESA